MSLDLTVLRLLRTRDRYDRMARAVPKQALDTRNRILLDDYGAYFNEFPQAKEIEHGPFMLWFKGFRHPKLKTEDTEFYDGLIKRAMEPVDAALEHGLIERLISADLANKLFGLVEKWTAGDEINLLDESNRLVDDAQTRVQRKVRAQQVLTPIENILAAEAQEVGLQFRLPCLQRSIKPLRKGDAVIVASRIDGGKTTFCADNLTFMAAQLATVYPDEDRDILWFANEGDADTIVLRCWQAALGVTVEEMAELAKQPAHKPQYGHRLRELYAEAIGGRLGAIRVYPVHDMSNVEIEQIIRKHNPGLLLFDMLDNVRFAGTSSNGGDRTDQILEAMYQWGRNRGIQYGCPVIATSQISGEGAGMEYPPATALKDSKTGKQGACDVILMIGQSNDEAKADCRYISAPKNKRARRGAPSSPRVEVFLDKHRARFKEPT